MWCAIQATFWRCAKSELTSVPVAGLHSNSRGDFVEPSLKCTAIAGLRNGLTLVATNHATLCVIDRLRVIKKYSDLDGVISELAPLEDRSFVAVVQEKQRVDLYINELDHEEVAGLTSPLTLCIVLSFSWCRMQTCTSDSCFHIHACTIGSLFPCRDVDMLSISSCIFSYVDCPKLAG
jgi:hypothetical protein